MEPSSVARSLSFNATRLSPIGEDPKLTAANLSKISILGSKGRKPLRSVPLDSSLESIGARGKARMRTNARTRVVKPPPEGRNAKEGKGRKWNLTEAFRAIETSSLIRPGSSLPFFRVLRVFPSGRNANVRFASKGTRNRPIVFEQLRRIN